MKPEVKKLAAEHGLHNAYKKESMGVCFVGEVGMKDFLKEYIDVEPGEIRELESDRVLGYHEGAVFYTIGQRHGLYLDGEKGVVNDGMPYYVVKKDVKRNIVYVSKNINSRELWTRELKLKELLFRSAPRPSGPSTKVVRQSSSQNNEQARYSLDSSDGLARADGANSRAAALQNAPSRNKSSFKLTVRLRHRAPLIPAVLDGDVLRFDEEVKRPASGQSAVFYDGEVCLGGGVVV